MEVILIGVLIVGGLWLYRSTKTYHASLLWYAIMTSYGNAVTPRHVFDKAIKHHHILLSKGCTPTEIYALILRIMKPSEERYLLYLNLTDAELFALYLDSLELKRDCAV